LRLFVAPAIGGLSLVEHRNGLHRRFPFCSRCQKNNRGFLASTFEIKLYFSTSLEKYYCSSLSRTYFIPSVEAGENFFRNLSRQVLRAVSDCLCPAKPEDEEIEANGLNLASFAFV
jgi:hypothetical protein